MPDTTPLPQDSDSLLRLAAQSMFDLYAQTVQGMMVVDRAHRVVWISEGYKRFLPALGFAGAHEFVGRRVEEVVPNTLLAQVIETGQPILVDLLTNQAGSFLVSRVPLRDAQGRVIGALGMVLMNNTGDGAGSAMGKAVPDGAVHDGAVPAGAVPAGAVSEGTMQPLMAKFAALQRELHSTQRQLQAEQARNRRPKYTIAGFIGTSPAALEVKRQARRVAAIQSTVLLLGETGTGKELLAQAIHAASPRAARAFVGVNIAAVPESLLEAEFFGVAPGAYTGAERKGRDGKFVVADGGTLFLDEIGDMPLPLQSKLLRALQEQEVEPLGSNQVRRVDVRVIAATSRDLHAMVADGRFRADLYYRLNVLPMRVPALRERLLDLEPLAEHLLDDIARRSGLQHKALSSDALDRLASHPWPGNIRELRNVLEQAALMTDAPVLDAADITRALSSGAAGPSAAPATLGARPLGLPPAGQAVPMAGAQAMGARLNPLERAPGGAHGVRAAVADNAAPAPIVPLPQAVAALEAQAIAQALHATGGNKVAAARLLGIARATLYEKLALLPAPPVVNRPA